MSWQPIDPPAKPPARCGVWANLSFRTIRSTSFGLVTIKVYEDLLGELDFEPGTRVRLDVGVDSHAGKVRIVDDAHGAYEMRAMRGKTVGLQVTFKVDCEEDEATSLAHMEHLVVGSDVLQISMPFMAGTSE